MMDEIPLFDENNPGKTIKVRHKSPVLVVDEESKTDKEELEALLEGDVAEETLLGDLARAGARAKEVEARENKTRYDFQKIANQVLKQSGMEIKDSVLKRRFVILLKSYFQSVRRADDLLNALTKKVQFGGVGFSKEKAVRVVGAVEKMNPEQYEISKPEEVPSLEGAAQFTTPVLEKELPKPSEVKAKLKEEEVKKKEQKGFFRRFYKKKTEPIEEKKRFSEEAVGKPFPSTVVSREELLGKGLAQLETEIGKEMDKTITKAQKGLFQPPEEEDKEEREQRVKDKVRAVGKSETEKTIKKEKSPKPFSSEKESKGKKAVEELSRFDRVSQKEVSQKQEKKPVSPRLVGPIEALRYTIEDFRRLSKIPRDRVGKIKRKLDLLKEESFSNRHLGLEAWMDSQVFESYMEITRKALEKGISIKDAIAELSRGGKEVLNEEEFYAVADLSAVAKS